MARQGKTLGGGRASAREPGRQGRQSMREQPAQKGADEPRTDLQRTDLHKTELAKSDLLAAEPRDAALEAPDMLAAKRLKLERRAQPGLSQTNRGLRMILVAAVSTVALSWGATVSGQYIEFLKVQELAESDPNALRVMCALNPPTNVSMIHLCETVAKMSNGAHPAEAVAPAGEGETETANAE